MKRIPLFNIARQYELLTPQILQAWEGVLAETAFTHGRETTQLEQQFAQFCQVPYALGVRSGTASLIIALKAAGIGPGDEVITTPLTFSATADAIALVGARPVFADVLPGTGNIDPAQVALAITPRTKAVLLVHFYGIPCDCASLLKLTKENKLQLIEDCSHAHGSLYKGRPVGSFGVAGCFSLFPAKVLGATGNAGVITTKNQRFLKLATAYAHHGILDSAHKYEHHLVGYNELIDNLQAAVLNLKLPLLPSWIKRKREIAQTYNQVFQRYHHPGMIWPDDVTPSLYVYAVQIPRRTQFQVFFETHGIETGIYYPVPLHLQRSFRYLGHRKGDFPVAERFARHTVSLPLYPELSDQEIQYICQVIEQYLTK